MVSPLETSVLEINENGQEFIWQLRHFFRGKVTVDLRNLFF